MNLLEKAKQVLTKRELDYFMIMNGRAGTLYIEGAPGSGKSAILKSIATKLGGLYLPFDSPAMEETEMGLYPKTLIIDGQELVKYVPPVWAYNATKANVPVFIIFEEINRNTRLMNAILNILNERRLGFEIAFGDNVFLAATGNLGTEDGTTVEEMDAAQKGRLIIKRHKIDGESGRQEWEEGFAAVGTTERPKGQVIPLIREYLKKNPANINPELNKNSAEVVVNARRWTFLSEAIIKNFGYDAGAEEILSFVSSQGQSYVGNYAIDFAKFLEENKRITIEDVLAGRAGKPNRDNAAELNEQLRGIDPTKLPKKQNENLIRFLGLLDDDLLAGYMSDCLLLKIQDYSEADYGKFVGHPNVKAIIERFKHIYEQL